MQTLDNLMWDRQPDEGPRAYQAFTEFLRLGPNRSLSRAYAAYRSGGQNRAKEGAAAKPPTYFSSWSSRFDWLHRAACYDFAQQQQARQEAQSEQVAGIRGYALACKTEGDRLVQLAGGLVAVAARGLSDLSKRIESRPLTPGEVARLLLTAAELGRFGFELQAVHLGLPDLLEQHRREDG